jgi:hypothetical protein
MTILYSISIIYIFGYIIISNKKSFLLLFTLLLLSSINGMGQIHSLKNTPFNKSIFLQKGPIKYIHSGGNQVYLDSLSLKKDQIQELIKTKNSYFLVTRGSGLVFKEYLKNDSLIHFKRIDRTQFDGYNFEDIKFDYHDTLFSIGGFGFWRNNGQIRYFTENREWELLLPELPDGISNRNIWNLDQENGFFYTIINSKEAGNKLYKINLANKTWSAEALPDFISSELLLNSEHPIQIQLNNRASSLLCYSNKIYYINLEKSELKIASNDKLLNFLNKNVVREASYFEFNNKLYIYNSIHSTIDSIEFKDNDFTSISKNSSYTNNKIIIAFIFLIIFLLIYYLFRKKNKSGIDINEFEKEFIMKLISQKGAIINIENLNYLLGLSKKSIEIQKKNRSEFLNKLNQKLKDELNTEDNIIIRIKEEEDKRVFVYQLNVEYFEKIEALM